LSANLNPSFLRFLHVSAGVKEYPIVRSIEGVYEEAIDRAVSVGVGLDLLGVSFDYAYEKTEHYEFKNRHNFSLGISF